MEKVCLRNNREAAGSLRTVRSSGVLVLPAKPSFRALQRRRGKISLRDESGKAEGLGGKRLEGAREGLVRGGGHIQGHTQCQALVIRISFHPKRPLVVELVTAAPFDR